MDTIAKISYLLEKNNRTQKELTDYLGLDKSTFSAWKNGKSKSYSKYFTQIAQFFNVSIDFLLDNEKSPTEESEGLDNVYFSLAKDAQQNGIDPDDIRLAIETIKSMKNRKVGE